MGSNEDDIDHEFVFVILIILVYVFSAHILEAARERGIMILMHESSVVTILGLIIGAFLKYGLGTEVNFNSGFLKSFLSLDFLIGKISCNIQFMLYTMMMWCS